MKRRSLLDAVTALALAAAYVALLLATVKDLGYARDEGFYFQAASSYERWFELLFKSPREAVQQAQVDRYWNANSEHPGLMKGLFALSHHFLFAKWHWFKEAGTAFRFPGMVVSALGVAVTYHWGARTSGRLAGLVAALSLAFIPPVFYHSHLDCFDMPVAAMWLLTTYAYWRSVEGRGSLGWALVTGVAYGLLLDTKHNAWLFPFAVLAHVALTRGGALLRGLRRGRVLVPAALPAMVLISPAVFYLLWPWIWFDTGRKLVGWVSFHLHHDYYNMEFLGTTYWKPPMPRAYAWLMTAATVPAVTLVLFLLGAGQSAWRLLGERIQRLAPRLASHAPPPRDPERTSLDLLWALCIATSYGPWLSSSTPIFGGTKHWITAYPFLALFAARGFALVCRRLAIILGPRFDRWRAGPAGVAFACVVGPIVMSLHAHPWGLSAYTPLVGGASGAANLGLNRGFWGYQTGAIAPFLNENVRRGGSVYVHDTALQSWEQLRADGRVRPDLIGTLSLVGTDAALYHHEQHMARVEQEAWIIYGTVAPAHIGTLDGVPIIWVYLAPR